jgi:threonine dehydrogenase-like Zn-dependent dehydrogenase
MKDLNFKAFDYTSDDTFIESDYNYKGDEASGWNIQRNGHPYLNLGPGYKLLKTVACGVCSTDIDRRFLPFPLPQIIGHEVIAQDLDSNQKYVVEINDTFEARGDSKSDAFIREGIPAHSPERKVLGIDRLPGGFGAYILAPKNAAIPFNGIPDKAAVLIEPFAASLQAVIASPPEDGDIVAVLGPRRLGSLVISALNAYRLNTKKSFKIVALARRKPLLDLASKLGADEGIDISKPETLNQLKNSFDIIYDTTSTPEGFLSAMQLAKRELHLKTTNGQKMGGLNHLTELVVDELSILPFDANNLHFHWNKEKRENINIYLSPEVQNLPKDDFEILNLLIQKELSTKGIVKISLGSWEDAILTLTDLENNDELPRFDLVITASLEEIDRAIRPTKGKEDSLVRPRGAILYIPKSNEGENGTIDSSELNTFFLAGKSIHSSRCGDFHLALQLLEENPSVATSLAENMISHEFNSKDLPEAFTFAKKPEAIKVMVRHV